MYHSYKSKNGDSMIQKDRREIDSEKPLKYFTSNYLEDKLENYSAGVFSTQGFGIPQAVINSDSELRRSNLTKSKYLKPEYTFPLPSIPYVGRGIADTDVQDIINSGVSRERKSCNPTTSDLEAKTFYIFDNLPIKPNGNVDNYVAENKFFQGEDTRQCNKRYNKH
jgi:hypothetical protein